MEQIAGARRPRAETQRRAFPDGLMQEPSADGLKNHLDTELRSQRGIVAFGRMEWAGAFGQEAPRSAEELGQMRAEPG